MSSGETVTQLVPPIERKRCLIEGCDRPARKRGWCETHYSRWKTAGDPLAPKIGRHSAAVDFIKSIIGNKDRLSDTICITWQFGRDARGRAKISMGGKNRMASRVVCEWTYGSPLMPRCEAAHSCGKGHEGCINPHHLRWATRSENEADKIRHGTSARGENQWMCKISKEMAMGALSLRGLKPQKEIAEMLGIRASHVSNIMTGKRWGWASAERQP